MSRGGSRWGAGRPGTRVKAEYLQRVDVREWARRGRLIEPGSFLWSWHRGGVPSGSIGVTVHSPHALTLRYGFSEDGKQRTVAQGVNVACTPCPFGGSRQWFVCPCCARRVALLYLRGWRFACRQCQRVAYASQSEDAIARLWRKQSKIEARLNEHWQRPKGMRRRTHDSLISALVECEERRELTLETVFIRAFGLPLPNVN